MPKIPIYQRQQSLSTQAPEVERNASTYGAVSGAQAGMWNTIVQSGAKIADTANDLYAKFQSDRDSTNELQFKLKTEEDSNNIAIGFLNARDENGNPLSKAEHIDQYLKQFDSTNEAALNLIENPELRAKAQMLRGLERTKLNVSLANEARKNGVEIGRQEIKKYSDELALDSSPEALAKQEEIWNSQKAKDSYGVDVAYAKGKEAVLKTHVNRLSKLTPEEAIAEINKGKLDIDSKEQDLLLSIFERKRNLLKNAENIETTGNEINTLLDIATNKVNVADMPALISSLKQSNPNLAAAAQSLFENGMTYEPKTDAEEDFAKDTETIFNFKDPVALSKHITQVATKSGYKQEERIIMLQEAIKQWQTLQTDGTVIKSAEKIASEAGLKDTVKWAQSAFAHHKNKQAITDVAVDYLANINNKMKPKDAQLAAQKKALSKEYPNTAIMDNPPNMVYQDGAPVRVVFPVGMILPTPVSRLYDPNSKTAKPVKTEKK